MFGAETLVCALPVIGRDQFQRSSHSDSFSAKAALRSFNNQAFVPLSRDDDLSFEQLIDFRALLLRLPVTMQAPEVGETLTIILPFAIRCSKIVLDR